MTPSPRGYVVVSGPPASGKTTLARDLAPRLDLPLLSKDTIKHALTTVLEVPDVVASRRLGRASVAALLAVARDVGSGVLEAPWQRATALGQLSALDGDVIEVFCRCDRETAHARFLARSVAMGPGDFDADRDPAELWNDDLARPLAGGWPVLEVDTTGPVDVPGLADVVAKRLMRRLP